MSFRNSIITIGKDFRFWVVLFFILRMYGITNPPLEAAHNWRQTLTCSIARNFYEVDPNIFYPRIDIDGEKSGIIASEFPVFNYLIYLVSKIFGYTHWYGRLINLIISSLGIYFFYLIIRKHFSSEHALYSGILLLCSLWFMYSRKIMPDTFSISLVIMGLYFALEFLYRQKIWHLLLFVILSALGGLSKIPSVLVLSVLIIPMFSGSVKKNAKAVLVIASAAVLSIVGLWYYYWVPYLQHTFGFQLFFEKDLKTGMAEISNYWREALQKFYFGAFLSYMAFAMFLFGLFYAFKSQSKTVLFVFIAGLLTFIFFAAKTGAVFPTHSYYILPFVPFMAFIAGYGLTKIRVRWLKVLIVATIIIESLANQQHDFRIKDKELYLLSLENLCDKISSKNDLIAFSGGPGYQQMYFAHRRGWSLEYREWNDPGRISAIKHKGCRLLFINKKDSTGKLNYKIIFENENYTVYKL